MRQRSKLGRIAMWAVILTGGYFAYRKSRAAMTAKILRHPGVVSGMGGGNAGAYPEGTLYPPGSGSSY